MLNQTAQLCVKVRHKPTK